MGAHISYARQWRNATTKQRIKDAKADLPRLGMLPRSFATKLHLLVSSACPQALHAMGASEIAEHDYASLRTAAARSLGFHGNHVRPDIVFGLILHPTYDPEFRVLRDRVQAARCILFKYSHKLDVVSITLALLPGLPRADNGFFRLLVQSLDKTSFAHGARAHLWETPWALLQRHLQRALEDLVVERVCGRKGFENLHSFDKLAMVRRYENLGLRMPPLCVIFLLLVAPLPKPPNTGTLGLKSLCAGILVNLTVASTDTTNARSFRECMTAPRCRSHRLRRVCDTSA